MTLQLDGIGRELPGPLERSRKTEQGAAGEPGARGAVAVDGQGVPEGPVFVDESGRRSRKYRRVGWALGVACTCYAVMLVVTVMGGNSSAPWLLIPGPASDKKSDTVREPESPEESVPGSTPAPGATAVFGPVDVVSTGAPGPRTTVSNGVRVTVPPEPGTEPAVAAPGKGSGKGSGKATVPAATVAGGGSPAAPSPTAPPVTGGGTEQPPPPPPSSDPTASTPVSPPEQPAPSESAPAPQKAHRRK